MNATAAAAALAAATTPADLADLNDWAVNTIRRSGLFVRCMYPSDAARAQEAMVRGERARVAGKTLEEYLRTSRSGSPYRLNRKTRIAVYVLLATR